MCSPASRFRLFGYGVNAVCLYAQRDRAGVKIWVFPFTLKGEASFSHSETPQAFLNFSQCGLPLSAAFRLKDAYLKRVYFLKVSAAPT